MKKLLLLFVFIGLSFFVKAQPLGNEWIDPTRVHYKFEISSDGIYRIPYSVLSSPAIFGTTLSSLNLNTLVLFHNGEKVPIYISTASNFGNSDYIEFYGKQNRGEIDAQLYNSPADQINPTYSLFTNTSVYYLTTNTGIPANPRYNVTANNINVPLTAEPYFMYKSQVNYPNGMYYAGKYVSQGQTELYKSIYDVGEGYTDNSYFGYIFTVLTPSIYTQGPDAIFRTTYANNSAYEFHDVKIIINNVQSYAQSATGFQLNHAQVNIPVSQLNNGNTSVQYVDNGNGVSQQKNVVGELSIEYPRTFNFSGLSQLYFEIEASASNKLLEITGFQDGGSQPVLYDITNGQIYRSVQPVGTYPLKFNLLPSAQKRSLYLRADVPGTFTFVGGLSPLNFTDYTNFNNQAEYYIITNSALLTLDANNINWVEEYRKYRDTKFAGARIADVDLLYDQFGYGIRKSPLAIRNFIRYLNTSTDITNKLHYVFLVGKAREAQSFRNGGTAYNQCLVPTFGYPGSDNLLAATQASDVPLVAIGRLAAENTTQIKNYLEKVRTYELEQNNYACNQDIPSKEWQKEILHFSGGTTSFEQFAFKGYVDSYKKMAEDSLWGAHVTTYTKTSNAPIESSLAQTIRNKINEGVSWITFFGHSATNAFDFSIDEPENYTNYGKYPILLSNGCFSGLLHDATRGYSEKFVFQPNAGMIAFMATSSLSISSGLNNFSTQLYKNTSVAKYNQPLGLGLKQTLTDLFQNPNTDDITKMTAYEMTLHGDPGLKPNHYPKPDYALDATSVYTTPLTVTPGTDSFDVNVIITNLGKCSVDDTLANGKVVKSKIVVKLTRTIFDVNQNPVLFYYYKTIRAPFLRDTVVFTVPVNIGTLGYGENRFEPFVDAQNEIDETESAECNNTLQTPFVTIIKNDDIIPIYPYDFAIVPSKGVTLKASTINPFAPERAYRFEIDTSELFNSPKLRSTVITQIGGVVHYPTDVAYYEKDSTVFYWRVRRDSAGNVWHYSSFIYLNGEYPGWNQSHHFQFQKDNYQNVRLDSFDRIFKFPPSTNQIHVRTGKSSAIGGGGNVDFETLGWDYNNFNQYRFRMGSCGYANPFQGSSGGLTFAVIDPVSGYPWYSHNWDGNSWGDQYGNVHCGGSKSGDQAGYDFNTTGFNTYKNTTWDTVISNFINDIPNGFYVLIYSVNNPPYTSWSTTLINALGQLGFVAQPFKSGAINGQLVYFTQKGNINYSSFTATSNGSLSILDTSFTFQGAWYQGSFTSPKIGPAVEWRSVHWQRQSKEGGLTADKDSIDIIGVRTNGADTVLITTTATDNLFYNGGPVISATEFPYLKLRLKTYDDSLRTPTQLYYWRVLYKKPPEAAVNPAAHFVAPNNVNIGSKLHFEIGLENVTDVPMPNLLTKYIIRDAALNTYNYSIRYDTLGGLDTLHLVFDTLINQNSFIGLNKITIEANPDNDQIEQFHFNNFAELDFNASGDKTNPLLDVTFDNQHILNGDIVSAKPNILVMLKDENKFLPLDRSSLFDIYIKYPGAAEPTKIDSTSSIFTFYPADGNNLANGNKAQIELKPIFTMDGTYELLIKDRDRSGNNSATTDSRYQGNNPATFFDYKISFEVITKPMITNVLNYPNPFTTATHFVFTITGSEVPDFMKIQIMTIKGTVVKEIFKEELGPLRVGRNITEYAWDGRDQYGDLLANGIYFYHVSTRLDDKQMDAMGMSYDKYFKKGFGKMAIVR